MAITYTRTTLGSISDLTATTAASGSLTASTQFWFVVVPLTAQYYTTNTTAWGAPSNIATATTDTTNKTINLSWTAVSGAYGYIVYWTKVDPGTNPENFNFSGWQVKVSTNPYYSTVTTNSFSFATEQISGTPTYSVKYDDAYRFVMISSVKTDTIALSTVDATVTPEGIYQACVLNSWDSITKLDDDSYYFATTISVGSNDSSVDLKGKNLILKGGFVTTAAGSMLYAGYSDRTTASTEGTSMVFTAGQGISNLNNFHIHDCRLHGLRVSNIRIGNKTATSSKYLTVYIYGDDFQISNCSFDLLQFLGLVGGALSTSYMVNTSSTGGRYCFNFQSDVSLATFSNNMAINGYQALYIRFSPTITKMVSEGTAGGIGEMIAINATANEDLKATFIDSNFDWSQARIVYWYQNGRMPTGEEYVKNKYTQTFHITDTSNNDLEGVSISLTDKNGISRGTATTDSGGLATIITEVGESKSNATTAQNYGTYTNHNPFNFVITKDGYETEDYIIEITGATHHIVPLKPQIPNLEDDKGNVYRRVDKTNSGTTNLRRKLVKV